jgi:histidinol-phosphate aminotransferase
LREALGEVHGLDPDRIACGNGSDDLLHLIAQCYLGAGDEAVMSRHGFNVYPIVTRGASAEIVMAPERDYRADVDAMLGAVTERTRVVFLANPNNPTGTYLKAAELERLQAGLRPDILFVLDSAYAEYVTAPDYEPGIALVEASENTVMVRTFSKIGLPARGSAGCTGPPMCSMPSTASAARSTSIVRPSSRARRQPATAPSPKGSGLTMRAGARG